MCWRACRSAHYPTELLSYAYHNRQGVLEAERQLNSFLADTSSRRCPSEAHLHALDLHTSCS